MSFRSPSVACPPWFIAVVAGPALLFAAAGGCTARALIAVDVVGDAPFQNVTLRLSAAETSKDFGGVSFSADMPFKAGLYVDGGSNTLTVTARALNGGNCIGIGTGSATGVSAGSATTPVVITVTHSSSCTSAPTGTGGTNGAGTGGSGDGAGARMQARAARMQALAARIPALAGQTVAWAAPRGPGDSRRETWSSMATSVAARTTGAFPR